MRKNKIKIYKGHSILEYKVNNDRAVFDEQDTFKVFNKSLQGSGNLQ